MKARGSPSVILLVMLPAFLFLLGCQPADPIVQLDALAQKRDIEGLKAMAAPELLRLRPDAFMFVRRGGAYGSGMSGWRVMELKDVAGERDYAVFTTKLTGEDIGEQVFEVKGGKLTEFVPEWDDLGVRLERHEFDIKFNLAAKQVDIVDEVSFAKTDGAGKSFMFRIFPNYKVSSVKADGKAVTFLQTAGTVSLPVAGSAKFKYTIAYSGITNSPQFAGSISEKEVQLTNDHWYPMVARRPAPYSATVHVPQNWTVVGQGEPQTGSPGVFKFKMDLPAVYYSLSAGPYKTATKKEGGKTWVSWSAVLGAEEMALQNELNKPVVDYFAKAFQTPYPFSQWGSLISEVYGGGALEAYSFATYGTGWLPDEDAHEPSHTWWGGIIPNTYLKSFWNESFANWSDQLYRREGPVGKPEEKRLAFVDTPQTDPNYTGMPVYSAGADAGPAASALGYGKGSLVLQMLEAELGTPKMLETCAEWLRSHPKGEPGEWDGYEKVVDRVTGKSYKWFFDQWLRRTGWVDFDLVSVQWLSGKLSGRAQFASLPYRLTCEVLLQYPDGRREMKSVLVDGATPFSLAVPSKPELVSFDPYHKLLRRFNAADAPLSLDSYVESARKFVDPKHADWMPSLARRSAKIGSLPADLNGLLIIGSPATVPALVPLCKKVGFVVVGDKLTYDGTTIDLKSGGAMAVVELGEGKRCAIALGKTRLDPRTGHSRLALVDNLGRFLRGKTEPRTTGWGVFRL